MTRFQFTLNFTIVVLLVGLAAGLIAMPRYNYGHMMARVAKADAEIAGLQGTVEKLNILAGPTEEKRAAVLGNLDSISAKLGKLDLDFVGVLEHTSANSERIEGLARQVEAIERIMRGATSGETESTGSIARSPFREPDGRPAGHEAAIEERRRRDPRTLAQLDFDGFLRTASDEGLVPSIDVTRLSDALRARLMGLFKSFQTCVDSINASEQLFTQELVERATRTGSFTEEEHAGSRDRDVEALPGGGTVFVKFLDGGRRRVFRFPGESYPALRSFEELRERAQASLLASLKVLREE